MSNGENNSVLDQQIAELKKYIDDFEESINLPYNAPHISQEELQGYFELNRQQITFLSIEECCLITIRLAEYEIFLQRTINREKNYVEWCKTQLDKTVSKNIDNYGGSWDMQYQKAINDDSYTSLLQERLQKLKLRIGSIENLNFSIQNLIKQIESIRYIKRPKNEH